MKQRAGSIVLLALAGLLSLYVFLGEHKAERAKRRISPPAAADRAGFPWLNARLEHARGRSLFERGVNRLGEAALRDADFSASRRAFLKSLALDPFSPTAHFDFGQALQYFNALNIPSAERYADEYRKAADLSGADTAIYREVGRVLVSRWTGLAPEDRRLAQEIVRSLLSVRGPEQETRLETFLRLWELNIRDAAVLEKILPADAGILRGAARFLGERALFPETRLACLATAEAIEFALAADEARAGQSSLNALRLEEALGHFRSADRLLDGIRFVQALAPRGGGIAEEEYSKLRRRVRLGILKARLDEGAEPRDYFNDFRAYLEVEDGIAAVKEAEILLKSRGVVDDRPSAGFIDSTLLSMRFLLDFKQSRFQDVVERGEALSRNALIIPGEQRRAYADMFEIIGDSAQRLDNLYESNEYYEKALDLGAEETVVLIKMRRNYERLNEEASIRAVQARIDAGLAPREAFFTETVWKAGEAAALPLFLDEKTYRMEIAFSDAEAGPLLVSLVFNGRILGEPFVDAGGLAVTLPAALGRNLLDITPLNRDCLPVRVSLVPEERKGISPEGPPVDLLSRNRPNDTKRIS